MAHFVTKFKYLIQILFILQLVHVKVTHNLSLPDETGGYSVVVAVDDSISQGSEAAPHLFVDNVKSTFDKLSQKLWESTRHTFYIKSVDILLPTSWNVNASVAVNQNYRDASIRLKPNDGSPYVENPKLCGVPGEFIELPFSMLNSSEEVGPYGPKWKMLLNLWATYRWGVHEEHGYTGDLKFPYVYRDLTKEAWEVTGCSDQPLQGNFKLLNDPTQQCSAQDTLNTTSTCRFIPESTQNATSSLMHFHWIESVESFCDEESHNRQSPNRQNSLCDHKSVWEVIRETNDFKSVKSPINDTNLLPSTTFQIVQHSAKPVLYILIDEGRIQGSLTLANFIPRALINFLSNSQWNSTLAAVGKYSDPGSDAEPAVTNVIDWTPIGANVDRFADVIGNLRTNGSIKRDFSQAVLEAARKIRDKGHPSGVVMLAIKYGADLSNFGNYASEYEVFNSLNEEGIIFNSIELEMTNHSGYAHLAELARQTGGIYTSINNYGTAERSLSYVFDYLENILNETYTDLKKNYRTILKTSISSGRSARFTLPSITAPEVGGNIQIYFSTTDPSLGSNDFVLEGVNSQGTNVRLSTKLRKSQDWQEDGSKWTYLLQMKNEEIISISEVNFLLNCAGCRGSLQVRTDIEDTVARNVSLSVFTNKESSNVDLSTEEPLIIYAKVLKSGAPVDNAVVTAIISEVNSYTTTEIQLNDKGDQGPDEQSQDGIYSGYFIPQLDGKFKISVTVKGGNILVKQKTNVGNGWSIRLLPIDQGDLGCSSGANCNTEHLPEEFMQTIDLSMDVSVRGSALYSPEPSKITSFSTFQTSGGVQLIWIAPTVPGRLSSVSSYDIRKSSDYGSLITKFDDQEKVTLPPGTKPPGSIESLTLSRPTSTTFYAIKSIYRGKTSKISDIQGIEIEETSTTAVSESTSSSSTSDTTSSDTSPTTTSSSSSDTSPTATSSSSTETSPESTTSGSTDSVPPDSSTTTNTGSTSETTEPPSTSSDTLPTDPTSTSESTTISTSTEAPVSEPPSTPKDEDEEEKPWHKRAVGIAVITVSVVVAVLIILVLIFIVWKKWKKVNVVKINPPPQIIKSSIPDTVPY